MVIYSINPASVSELYTTKSKAFHAVNENGDTVLMFQYISTIARNAAYKAVAKYPAMDTVRKRDEIEAEIVKLVNDTLKAEKLDSALTITQVSIRSIQPAQSIINSANAAIAKQNELIAKQKEVEIAQAEAERQAFLSRPANLEYMRVQAQLLIAEAVKEGKVSTIIIPSTLTMLGNAK